MCVCVLQEGRGGGCTDGCEGDVLTQPRVSGGRSRAEHIITQGGRKSWTGQALLFLPAAAFMHGGGRGVFNMSLAADETRSESRMKRSVEVKSIQVNFG